MLGKRRRKNEEADDAVLHSSASASAVDTPSPPKRTASKGKQKSSTDTAKPRRRSGRVPASRPSAQTQWKNNNSRTPESARRTRTPTRGPARVRERSSSTPPREPATPDEDIYDPGEDSQEVDIFEWLDSVNRPGGTNSSSLSSAPISSRDSTPEPLPTLPPAVTIGHSCLAWDRSCYIPAKLVDFIPTASSGRHFLAENRLGQRYQLPRSKILFMYVPEDEQRMMGVTIGEVEPVLKDAASREMQQYAEEQVRAVEPLLRRLLAEEYAPAQWRVDLFHRINSSPNPVWRSLDVHADVGDLLSNQTVALHHALSRWLDAELAAFSAAPETSTDESHDGRTAPAAALPATMAAELVPTPVANGVVASSTTPEIAPVPDQAPALVPAERTTAETESTPAAVETAATSDTGPAAGVEPSSMDPAATSPEPSASTKPKPDSSEKEPAASTEEVSAPMEPPPVSPEQVSAATEKVSTPTEHTPIVNGTANSSDAAQAAAEACPAAASAPHSTADPAVPGETAPLSSPAAEPPAASAPVPSAAPVDASKTEPSPPSPRWTRLHPERLANFALSVLVPETLIALCIQEFSLDSGSEGQTYNTARKRLRKLGDDPTRQFWEDLSERLNYLRRRHDDALEKLERTAPSKPDNLLVTLGGRRTRRVLYKD